MRNRLPIGFLPFQFHNAWRRLLGAAERVGEEMTDYFGLVAEPGVMLDPQTLLRLSALESLHFTHLDETQLQYGLSGEKPEAGFQMRLDQAPSYWDLLRRTHKEFVTNTERRQRQVEAQLGPLRFTPRERDWQAPLRELMEYKGRQYQNSGRQNLFDCAWKRRLMEVLAASQAGSCSGVLSTLHAGDTWLGSHFGLYGNGVLHYWFPVYNPDFSRFGPGRLLIKALIDRAPEMGIRMIDHGGGDARYKRECSNAVHTYYRGAWHTGGLRSFAGRAAEAAKWRLERMMGQVKSAT
jgi:CelD/BcsL family acetyltransferase involved in cellulose biosynthesis